MALDAHRRISLAVSGHGRGRAHSRLFPFRSSATGVTLARLSATSVRATFSRAVLVLPTLTWPGAYAFTPTLAVERVATGATETAGAYESTRSVTLTTAEQGPEIYDLTVYGLEVA